MKPSTQLHTILGAGGVIANELVAALGASGPAIRLVGRNPQSRASNTSTVAADLTDLRQTFDAVAGSSVVYLLVGLKYDSGLWEAAWPKIMANTIAACEQTGAKLIFFDNVYMYGRVTQAMTEETAFNPCSRKGEVRAKVATMLLEKVKSGTIRAAIARSADFYGPQATNGVPNLLVFDKLAKGRRALALISDRQPHSLTFTQDAARGLALLAVSERSWGQTWHLPTRRNPPTVREFIALVARQFGVPAKSFVLSKSMLRMAGLFDGNIRETIEMAYQHAAPYLFDSGKFEAAFSYQPASYEAGVRITAADYPKALYSKD